MRNGGRVGVPVFLGICRGVLFRLKRQVAPLFHQYQVLRVDVDLLSQHCAKIFEQHGRRQEHLELAYGSRVREKIEEPQTDFVLTVPAPHLSGLDIEHHR